MIPSTREILTVVYGAWTLLKLDPKGLEYFDVSVEAFWRSFFAAVIVAPGFALLRIIDYTEAESGSGFLPTLLVEIIAYVIIWAAFPLALHYLSLALDRQQHYLRAVIALNWSVVIQIALTLPVHLIAVIGILPQGLASLAIFVVLMVTLFYAGFVARTALEITPPQAALVIAMDVAISLAVKGLASGLLA